MHGCHCSGLRRAAHRVAGNDRVKLDEEQLSRFVRPFGLMVTWWVFLALLPSLSIESETVTGVLDVVGSLVYSVAGVLAAWRLVDLVCDFFKARAERSDNKFDDMLVPLLRRTLKIFVVVLGLAYFSSRLTEDVYQVIAGLSIGSAALLFAFKDSLENVFGTFTVLLDQPFQLAATPAVLCSQRAMSSSFRRGNCEQKCEQKDSAPLPSFVDHFPSLLLEASVSAGF